MGNTDAQLNPPHYKSQANRDPYNSNNNPYRSQNQYNNQQNNPYHQQNLYKYNSKPRHQTRSSEEKHFEVPNGMNKDNGLNSAESSAMEVFNSEAMNVCWVFWKDNVDILPRNKQKELALLLYCHMFQKIPSARRLFIRGEIDEQALKFLDMFGYLIRQLKDYESQNTLIKTLTSLGKRHNDWGVRYEYFEPMLNSLHSALSDHFKHTYTVRVKFCMEQIFCSAANIMTQQDMYNIFKQRYGMFFT